MAERITLNVSDETKKLFYELAEQPEIKSKEDFVNRLLTLYQADQIKESTFLKPAIEACQELNARMLEVLTGAAAMQATAEEKHSRALDEQRASYEATRETLQQRITYMEAERLENEERADALIADREAAMDKVAELTAQIERMTAAAADKDNLNAEYRKRIDTLTGLVSEYQEAAIENKTLTEAVSAAKRENENLNREISDLNRKLERQAATADADRETLRRTLMLDKDAAILEIRQQSQAEAEVRQAKYAAQIAEYQTRIENMLTEREKVTAAPTPAKKASRKTFKTDAANIEQFFSGQEPEPTE